MPQGLLVFLFTILFPLCSFGASSYYKCVEGGKTVYKDHACTPTIPNPSESKPVAPPARHYPNSLQWVWLTDSVRVQVNDTADRFGTAVGPLRPSNKVNSPDPDNPDAWITSLYFEIDGREIRFVLRRPRNSPSYMVSDISGNDLAKTYSDKRGYGGKGGVVRAAPTGTLVPDEPVDCYALSKYGEARGDNFIVRAETVANARRKGLCK